MVVYFKKYISYTLIILLGVAQSLNAVPAIHTNTKNLTPEEFINTYVYHSNDKQALRQWLNDDPSVNEQTILDILTKHTHSSYLMNGYFTTPYCDNKLLETLCNNAKTTEKVLALLSHNKEKHPWQVDGIIEAAPKNSNPKIHALKKTISIYLDQKYKKYNNTATMQHYRVFKKSIHANYADLQSLFEKVLPTEQKLNNEGYTTFYHAQKSDFICYERWHTFLNNNSALPPKTPNPQFLSFHIKPYESKKIYMQNRERNPTNALKNFYKKEAKKRNFLLKNGNEPYGYSEETLLFLNACLFGNTRDDGESSASYYKHNTNANSGKGRNFTLKQIFTLNGFKKLYKKYQHELGTIESKYKNLFKNQSAGIMHLIAIPHNQVNKSVYSAYQCGPKRSVSIRETDLYNRSKALLKKYIKNVAQPRNYKKLLTDNISYLKWHGLKKTLEKIVVCDAWQTHDVQFITQTYRHAIDNLPEKDFNLFCLVMTEDPDGGLNPESGIKVFPFVNPAIEKECNALTTEEQQLMDHIAQDMKQNNIMPEYEC